MVGNAAEGSEWRTCTDCVGGEGREGGEGMGVNERSSERASEEGSSLRALASRQRVECHGGERVALHMHAASNPHTLFFASLNEEFTVLYGE